ncbi:hypothetical protein PENSPDRAFT_667028 [Peniophora sp. CONT]|nr:hypothetical protein PENSPDRAFT_667028 [Peniophora sp. CONT]
MNACTIVQSQLYNLAIVSEDASSGCQTAHLSSSPSQSSSRNFETALGNVERYNVSTTSSLMSILQTFSMLLELLKTYYSTSFTKGGDDNFRAQATLFNEHQEHETMKHQRTDNDFHDHATPPRRAGPSLRVDAVDIKGGVVRVLVGGRTTPFDAGAVKARQSGWTLAAPTRARSSPST